MTCSTVPFRLRSRTRARSADLPSHQLVGGPAERACAQRCGRAIERRDASGAGNFTDESKHRFQRAFQVRGSTRGGESECASRVVASTLRACPARPRGQASVHGRYSQGRHRDSSAAGPRRPGNRRLGKSLSVVANEAERSVQADENGGFLLRGLSAGPLTPVVKNLDSETRHFVVVPAQPGVASGMEHGVTCVWGCTKPSIGSSDATHSHRPVGTTIETTGDRRLRSAPL